MSFMPNRGSLVRLNDGRVGLVSKVTPKGDDDRVWTGGQEERVTAWDIREVIHEPVHETHASRPQTRLFGFDPSPFGYGEDPGLPTRAQCPRCGRDVAYLQLMDHDGGVENACVYCLDTRRHERESGEWVVVPGTFQDGTPSDGRLAS